MRGILRSAIALMFVCGFRIHPQAHRIRQGSYQQTCRNIDFHDKRPCGELPGFHGRWQSALLRERAELPQRHHQ